MRVVFADTTIHGKLIGGGHLFLPKLIKGLVGKGFEVHLVTTAEPNERVYPQLSDSGAKIHFNVWDRFQYVESSMQGFAGYINDLDPDIYIISASADMGWVVLPLLNSAIATLTIGHTDDETFYLPARHYRPFLSGAIGVSREICESYINSCKLDSSRVAWIPYGVETAGTFREAGNRNRLRIIYAGRIEEEQKRISDIIAVSKRLTEKEIPYELHIVGDGTEVPKLKKELQDEIARNTVILHGWVNAMEVGELLRQSDIFLLTSDYEGFCIALVEAMANGCCPVVSDIRSGNKDLVVSGENGFLVPVGDVNGFVQRITSLWKDPGMLLNLRKAAWEKGREFTTDRMVDNYAGFFYKAIQLNQENPREISPGFPLLPTCRSKYPVWMRNLKVLGRKALNKLSK